MEKLNVSTGLLEVSVNKYDDLLILNCADLSVFNRFAKLYENVETIADSATRKLEELNHKHGDDIQTGIADAVCEYVGVNIDFSRKVMLELNNVFGDGFTDKVFRENYELNPDFVPDEIALTDLLEALVPIMEKAYGERMKRNRSKYSAKKRGKNTTPVNGGAADE